MMMMAVSASDFMHSNLQGFDVGASMLWPKPISPASELIGDAVGCPNNSIVVSDGAMATGGLRIYENLTEKTTAALAIGLSPKSAQGLVCF